MILRTKLTRWHHNVYVRQA